MIALECGWIVTEVGRQPWIVFNILRTKDAATRSNGVWVTLIAIVLLDAVLGTALVVVLRAMARRWRAGGDGDFEAPYGPSTNAPPEPVAESQT